MRLLIPGQMRPRRFRRRLAGARAAFANTTDMLEHLRRRLNEALAGVRRATVSTYGPAGLQAGVLPCEWRDPCLYTLVPRASDQRFNLESAPDLVASAEGWQVTGRGRILNPGDGPRDLALRAAPEARWSDLVEITPARAQLFGVAGRNGAETIDFT